MEQQFVSDVNEDSSTSLLYCLHILQMIHSSVVDTTIVFPHYMWSLLQEGPQDAHLMKFIGDELGKDNVLIA